LELHRLSNLVGAWGYRSSKPTQPL